MGSSSTTELDPKRIREVNIRYHDAAAATYDAKWGIDYGEIGSRQVMMKLSKAIGRQPRRFARSLEIGAGTGYFSINLLRGNVIARATATDISSGMLQRLAATADELGLEIETVQADAEALPFEDRSFDLVFGHAVLHHLPNLDVALSEFARVLRPGGMLVFMGEPSSYGDAIAALPKRFGELARPLWRRAVRARNIYTNGSEASDEAHADHALEPFVDVHTFSPSGLRDSVQSAGFEQVRLSGEELLANMYGWTMRTLEAGTEPTSVPKAWHHFAFRTYLALQWVDNHVLERRLPPEMFYNLLISARKPS
jgi:ubiquinone/menaquinone biosynthesis C-methylase UbiE